MNRRTFLQASAALTFTTPLLAAVRQAKWDDAAAVLEKATASKQVAAAALHVEQGEESYSRRFGTAATNDAMFLLGSISKPINITAVMTLFDQGKFALDDPVKKFLPKFTGDGRDSATFRHLLSHISGLPDQLPNNNDLRRQHASLTDFADHAQRTPLAFAPGAKYSYSSMGILLATRIAELISGTDILTLTTKSVLEPLGMKHSAQGLGMFKLEDFVRCQADGAAPESGAGDPTAKEWDWNSAYWRKLGAPWGSTHASAPDIAKWLNEFLYHRGKVVKPETAKRMTSNQNPAGLKSRGLGFDVGKTVGGGDCSEQTFGHTGSTGTICWADPESRIICVVLTSLPAKAVSPHPRTVAAEKVAAAKN
jgi:CubicO group peptidase (beta-lactamase class C family)